MQQIWRSTTTHTVKSKSQLVNSKSSIVWKTKDCTKTRAETKTYYVSKSWHLLKGYNQQQLGNNLCERNLHLLCFQKLATCERLLPEARDNPCEEFTRLGWASSFTAMWGGGGSNRKKLHNLENIEHLILKHRNPQMATTLNPWPLTSKMQLSTMRKISMSQLTSFYMEAWGRHLRPTCQVLPHDHYKTKTVPCEFENLFKRDQKRHACWVP